MVKIYLYLRKKYGRNKYIYGHAVFLSLLPLLVYKIGGLRGYSVFGFLGISYICFKIIQVVIECYDGVIKEIDEFQFIEFLIFFPCLSSGPIDRSRRFAEDDNKIWSRQEYIELLWTGLYKIILGIFYKVACSGFFYYLLQTYFAGRHRPIYLVGYAYIYGLYLFFDFAGYSAMAVGTSYLLGIKTPDNFNKPFLSVDIKDFWNRWHITLSSWFRDFIFTRFMVDSARKKRFSNRLTGASVGLILNMLIMGVWHGLEGHYIVTENQTTITHIPPYKIFCSSCSDEKNTLIYSLFLAARIDCLSFRDAHQIPLDILRNVCLVPLGRMTPDNQLIALRLRLLVHHDIVFGRNRPAISLQLMQHYLLRAKLL